MKRILMILALWLLIAIASAHLYKLEAGPWIVEFNSSQELIDTNQNVGGSAEVIKLIDQDDNLVAWINLYSFSTQLYVNSYLETLLNISIKSMQIQSTTERALIIDGSAGKGAEGFSSKYNRIWRGIAYPFNAKYNAFAGTNTSKYFITFNSLQEPDQFREIEESFHVINLAVISEEGAGR
jgi:hypothetical protein